MRSHCPATILLASALTGPALAQLGTNYCAAVPNSTGAPSSMSAAGSLFVHTNDVTLGCGGLPPGTFGYFLVSRDTGFVQGPGGSAGNLCLGAPIGRYSNSVQVADSSGAVSLVLDLTLMPGASTTFAVANGDTLRFQYWHRDAGTPPTSNFSDGLEVRFGYTPGVANMVPILPGTFEMGSEGGGFSPVVPVHDVTLSYLFWMSAYEVTHAEYVALTASIPHTPVGPDHPVEWVSWHSAKGYCELLTQQQQSAGLVPPGYEYRFPTEAEWEYACRAGTTTEYSVGPALLCGAAQIRLDDANVLCNGSATTAPVGSYAPNPWGLYDLHGNVWEWCLDNLAPYQAGAVVDPFVTGGGERVIRGGARNSWAPQCRSANRFGQDEWTAYENIGFRVVLGPALVP